MPNRESRKIATMPAAAHNNVSDSKRRRRIALCTIGIFFVVLAAAIIAVFATSGFNGKKDSDADALTSPSFATQLRPTAAPTMEPVVIRGCNGMPSLCDVRVNATMFATAHNANSDKSVVLALPNQDEDINQALNAGIRGINMDIGLCKVNEEMQLSTVHGTCLLGYRTLDDVFTGINNFLSEQPHEVIIMPIQINDDTGGNVSLNDIHDVMQQVVDAKGVSMADRLYQYPGPGNLWPTLQELIDMDRRILFFVYNGAETCQKLGKKCPPGFHDWFQYAAETAFSFQSVQEIVDSPSDACRITRGSHGARDFFGINLFLELPDSKSALILNNATFLKSHIETCSEDNGGLKPNLILVDFWDLGDVIDVVQEYNEKL